MSYASNTSVGVDKSKTEVERTLSRYGAESFGYGIQNGEAIVMFQMSSRKIRFHLPLPKLEEFAVSDKGRKRRPPAMEEAQDQELRRRWRALALVIKAKLEAVESGISVFQDEFMANIVLPSGRTVSEEIAPKIDHAYSTGKPGALLLEFR